MEYIKSIINSIEKVFDVSEENISSLTVMLADIETSHLYNKFSAEEQSKKYLNSDLLSKANLLNALLEIVLENPNMDSIESDKRKELLVGLCGTVASLYEQVLDQINDNECWENMSYLVMYSMLSYMADRQTMSDLAIKEYNAKLTKMMSLYNEFPTMQKLEYDTYYLIVLLMSNIKNYDGLTQLNSYIQRANDNLNEAQRELSKAELDIPVGLKIASYGNIIYLTMVLKEYLFSGEIDSSENQDIYSVIDMYSYNAFHLLDNESIDLKLIGHLLRYAYERVAENSIWNVAAMLSIQEEISSKYFGRSSARRTMLSYSWGITMMQKAAISPTVSSITMAIASILAQREPLFALVMRSKSFCSGLTAKRSRYASTKPLINGPVASSPALRVGSSHWSRRRANMISSAPAISKERMSFGFLCFSMMPSPFRRGNIRAALCGRGIMPGFTPRFIVCAPCRQLFALRAAR